MNEKTILLLHKTQVQLHPKLKTVVSIVNKMMVVPDSCKEMPSTSKVFLHHQ